MVHEIGAKEVRARLEQAADGRANWAFDLPAPQPQHGTLRRGTPDLKDFSFAVNRIALHRLNVEYYDAASSAAAISSWRSSPARCPGASPSTWPCAAPSRRASPIRVTVDGRPAVRPVARGAAVAASSCRWTFSGTVLRVSGNLCGQGRSGELTFGMGTEDLSQIERLLQTKLPKVGATALSGMVHWEPGKVSIEPLNGVMGRTTLEGQLAFDYTGKRPKVSGELTLPVPRSAAVPERGASTQRREQPRSFADVYRELEKASSA